MLRHVKANMLLRCYWNTSLKTGLKCQSGVSK